MKKVLAVTTIILFVSASVYAEGILEENCGCGLGTMVFEGQDGVLSQTLAVTTNGIFANNLFGITSGTLGCAAPDSLVSIERLNIFVAGNMDNLAKDIAMGQGETLSTLAELMNINSSEKSAFFVNLRKNFSNIYTSDQVSNQQVVRSIIEFSKS